MNESASKSRVPTLIAIGGFPGTGKTTIARRLSSDLCIPRLGSDTFIRTIRGSKAIGSAEPSAGWIAYEVLFRLCEEFIQSGVSTILDLTMGYEFHWQHVDVIIGRYPRTLFLPVILRCSHEQCMQRIRQRYQARPEYYSAPEVFTSKQKFVDIWDFLQELDRPEIHFVDAAGDENQVYAEVNEYVTGRITRSTAAP